MNTSGSPLPAQDEWRELELLRLLEGEEAVTQRALSMRLGIALGLVNAFVKRLARKGLIKISTAPGHRIRYWLTPKGFAEKSRLTLEYLRYSFRFYRDARGRLEQALQGSAGAGARRLVLLGTGELAELAYLSVRASGWRLAAVVGDGGGRFLGHPVRPLSELSQIGFDRLLVADPAPPAEALLPLRAEGRLLDPLSLLPA